MILHVRLQTIRVCYSADDYIALTIHHPEVERSDV
jgi:hypothetical protein